MTNIVMYIQKKSWNRNKNGHDNKFIYVTRTANFESEVETTKELDNFYNGEATCFFAFDCIISNKLESQEMMSAISIFEHVINVTCQMYRHLSVNTNVISDCTFTDAKNRYYVFTE